MKKLLPWVLCLLVLTGCTPLLERSYSVSQPHSSKFWESEAADTLRAENYQDIVNDLLILIGQHTESATLHLYNYKDETLVADIIERATLEVQQETPMGAYAVEYITASSQAQRGYYEISVKIGYRRTAEQIQAVVNATSTEALYSLLETALIEGRSELAVRIGYWGEGARERAEASVAEVRLAWLLTENDPWVIHYYPQEGATGILEFLLQPTEEQLLAAGLLENEPSSGGKTAPSDEVPEMDEEKDAVSAEESEEIPGEEENASDGPPELAGETVTVPEETESSEKNEEKIENHT